MQLLRPLSSLLIGFFALSTSYAAPAPLAARSDTPVVAEAAQAPVLTPHRVAELRNVSAAVISPDGRSIAYTLSVPRVPMADDDGPNYSELWVVPARPADGAQGAPGAAARAFVSGKSDIAQLSWTPDSTTLLFLSKRGEDKVPNLYALPLAGGEARKALTSATTIASYTLAADGVRVAFVSTDPEPEARKKAQDKGFKQEIYEEDVKRSKVFVARLFAAGEKPREVPLEGSVHQLAWSPVDDRLLVTVAPTPLVDDEYMAQKVLIVDGADGKVLARFEHEGKQGAVRWSPDGRQIAMLAGADIHDPSDGRLFVGAASGGALRELTGARELDVDALEWQSPTHLLAVVSQGLETSFVKIAADGSEWKTLVEPGQAVLTSFSLSEDGQHGAFVGSTPAHPAEVFALSHGDARPARRTNSNAWLDAHTLAKQERVAWKARDGQALEGVLIRPLNERRGTRHPLIVYVHGGPEAHEQNGWQTSYGKPGQVAAALGYAVFYPNYRGSTGRGLAFSKLSQGDPAGKEFDDLVDAVDHLVASGLVDTSKVGVTGGSYGGYATAWCATRLSPRFAAGVMFVGISDKISKVGTTDIPNEEFYVHALHRVWDDWQFFLDRSPIKYAGDSKTPLLILHGKDDPRVNPGQSRELYRHLKLRGQAPVRLVLYPGEGHGNRKCAAKLDYNLRMIEWFEHYLKGPGGTPPAWEIGYADPAAK